MTEEEKLDDNIEEKQNENLPKENNIDDDIQENKDNKKDNENNKNDKENEEKKGNEEKKENDEKKENEEKKENDGEIENKENKINKENSNKKDEVKEEEKNLDNIDINKNINKDDDLNSSFDEKDDIKKSNKSQFTVILVGDSYVGKTSIIKKFIDDAFSEKMVSTISIDFKVKNIKINKNLYAELKIFDTAGQERYRSLANGYYKQADGIILVFDLTNENSFNRLNKWLSDIKDIKENVEIILVGNKSDLIDRKINKTKAESWAKENGFRYIETSAKDGSNILLLFEELAIEMNKRKEDDSSIVDVKSINTYVYRRAELNRQLRNKKESKCC